MKVVNVTLHGHLGEAMGSSWKLAVKSIREAIHAINTITQGKLYKYLYKKDKEGANYRFLINKRDLKGKQFKMDNANEALQSELVIKFNPIESIDIIPIIEGNDKSILGGLLVVIGVVLIVVGIVGLLAGGSGTLLILAGLSLVAGGISILLSPSPKFEPFPEIGQGSSGRSYLFGGSVNITAEGGPVPVGYGELVVGSQVISVGYSILVRVDSLLHASQNASNYYPIKFFKTP